MEDKKRIPYSPYDNDRYPQRTNPRLVAYNYTTENYYFLTICTQQKSCIFGSPLHLNALGHIAQQGIQEIPNHFPGIHIEKSVVMPNHVHILLYQQNNPVGIPNIVGAYKSFVSRQIHKLVPGITVWQSSFHDHIIRNEKSYQNIWSYIESNPINWEKDCFFV